MNRPAKFGLPQMLPLLDLWLSAGLIGLMVISAITESIGLLLMVPMLETVSGSGGDGRFARALAAVGIPRTLEALLIVFCLLIILRVVINVLRNYTAFRLRTELIDRLRTRAWDALVHCDWRTFSTFRQSDSLSVLITSVDSVGHALGQGLNFIAITVTLSAIGLAALALSVPIALGSVTGGLLVLYAYRGMRRRAQALGQETSDAYRDMHGYLSEGLRAMRTVKSLGLENAVSGDAVASFRKLRRAELTLMKDEGFGQIIMHGVGGIVLALGVWLAITRLGAGLSEVVPMAALFARALPMLAALQEALLNWEHSSAALGGTIALIERTEAAREPDPGEGPAPGLTRELVLDGVGVQFAESLRPALAAIDLTIAAGTTVALVGASGAGKSTLADLVGGLLSPDSGKISLDGTELSGAVQRAWRSRVAYVQQEPLLFHGSVRDNLARANPAADERRMARALADASARFVDTLPQGIDTVIGDGGRRLSGGEQQRIALARSLMRDPALLILDEATSALDSASEASVVEAIRALQGKLTILIIAHRGALVALADRVIELAEGRIIGFTDTK